MAFPNCGIASVTPLDSLSFRVTFAPEPGGTAIPTEADCLDLTKWVFTTAGLVDPLLVLVLVEKVSDYVYDLYTNHRALPPGLGLNIESAAITTDQGGYCDSPEVEGFFSISDPVDTYYDDPNTFEWGPTDLNGEPLYVQGDPPRRKSRRRR